jgi:uncharacterized protein
MPTATFRFHGSLADFLPRGSRGRPLRHDFEGAPAIKDRIESIGVPHPEVDLIDVAGVAVGFAYRLRDGDEVDVHPIDGAARADPPGPTGRTEHLVPPIPRPERFVLDGHLGRLAAYLRLLGFDTLYTSRADDVDLAGMAGTGGRILLTRDRGLLKRRVVVYGYFVREDNPRRQLAEVARRYGLASSAASFTRCSRCNGRIEPVERDTVAHLLQERTLRYYEAFGRCGSCGAVYWEGSHVERMRAVIAEALSRAAE